MKPKIALAIPPKQEISRDQVYAAPQAGLGYIAGGLCKADHKVKVYNSKFANIYEKELTQELIDAKYDIVGFSAMTCEITSVARIAKNIKAANKECKIVVGGCHTNAIPERSMQEFPDIDLICIGEHEDQIGELFQMLHDRAYDDLENTEHIIFRRNGEVYHKNLIRRIIKDIQPLPWPAYHLFGNPFAYPVLFSARGCPFSCNFCQRNSGKKLRKRDPVDICDEIEYFTTLFHSEQFTFRDECFAVNKRFTTSICEEMIRRGLNNKVRWTCETHASTADYDLFCLMRDAGCYYLEFGVESGSDQILRQTRKGTTVEMIENAFEIATKAKLKRGGMFILGHLNETKKTMFKTISLAARLNPDNIGISIMTPYPGTGVYEMAKRNTAGVRLLTEDWEKYDNLKGTPMGWEKLSIRTVKTFQLLGLFLYYLSNFRFRQLFYYLRHHKNWKLLFMSILRPKQQN
jgi:radical SAM superfamily enzyme YgiQ (UPF0313 family)